ncbi:MAG: phosphoribosylamine--glycine ligase [Candidatus Omnitrophica bacterium]|nr:phosphoribosylamine--glycine ligase [Candidatus Omnitrophota bacterium]
MKILVIGSGGREHALVWKLSQSQNVKKIFCAPGNGGISKLAECIPFKADDIPALAEFCIKERIDFTVVGPEVPLCAGIVDELSKCGLDVFGPNKAAAQMEGSKVFSKQIMAKYKVPTAAFEIFDDPDKAKKYIDRINAPCVVKADGLAAGKGVVVAQNPDEAKQAVVAMMEERIFGAAGDRIIIEDCLQGQEASILVFTDSREVIPLASSQDHKRVFDNDRGPNTGGMGAYSPAPIVTRPIFQEILEKIVYRTIEGLMKEGITYKGVLYAGVMLTPQGPKALEFNVRFGDPETQAILPRLKSDLLEVMMATSNQNLSQIVKSGGLKWDNRACACVVCASGGYPGDYQKDKEISGLEDAAKINDTMVFHAGTRLVAGKFLTAGGRVLGVTGLGRTIKDAVNKAYLAVDKIHFEGMHFRKDIGAKAIK